MTAKIHHVVIVYKSNQETRPPSATATGRACWVIVYSTPQYFILVEPLPVRFVYRCKTRASIALRRGRADKTRATHFNISAWLAPRCSKNPIA